MFYFEKGQADKELEELMQVIIANQSVENHSSIKERFDNFVDKLKNKKEE